ncbi:Protein OSCP1 [Pseudolycoriella hygida]|uniref:Protein OSCP1 n=1 Tax=Pseudolycoriella hygida TaxID=35572 RepID=A0A9Q0MKF6_9DIPT|nr:Protein OSCP1 [Pseudolycoriella hygida]
MSKGNIFLVLNLGCEMLYVIDQRLKAQRITVEKSAQVLRDLTCVLLDPKFLAQFLHPHPDEHLLTPHQIRLLLSDIACCSLMRLDINSMDKLWDLMVMVFKWQLTISSKDPQSLVDITFRHMDGIGRLIPESRKTMLVDCGKRLMIEFWDEIPDKDSVVQSVAQFLQPFNVKISILIRLGFQRSDTTFETNMNGEHFQYYVNNVGENIYAKHSHSMVRGLVDRIQEKPKENSREIDSLVEQLNIRRNSASESDVNHSGGILDEVRFNFTNENICEVHQNVTEAADKSEFVRVERNVAANLENIMEQFRLASEEHCNTVTEDVTEELLKMLDEN